MRLRRTLGAALGAVALVATSPASASAATGDFSYKFVGLDGSPQSVTLHDPLSPGCITLPEVADTKPCSMRWSSLPQPRSRPVA